MNIILRPPNPSETWWKLLFRLFLFVSSFAASLAFVTGLWFYKTYGEQVPDFHTLEDYRPKLVTHAYDQSGQLIGEFFRERRILVHYNEIPQKLIQGILASEDDRFFEHQGIDYVGILRALIANLKAGKVVQGGSTITQQVAKSLLISEEGYHKGSEKKLSRKIKEAILATRLEQKLRKEDILTLYLNQIFLGNQAYGVQAAAQNYFRKDIHQMNLAEMALLAGLPQAPSRYSPFLHPEKAKERREYVLRRMLEEKFITEAELREAQETPITVYPAIDISREVTPYFTEHVRKILFEKYGEDRVLNDGLQVWTTVDVERYRAAEDAAYRNLRLVDKRQGFRGPLTHLNNKDEIQKFLNSYQQELKHLQRNDQLETGETYLGLVTQIEPQQKNFEIQVGKHRGLLPLAAMRWARAVDPNQFFDQSLLSSLPKSIHKGDVLLVRKTTKEILKKDSYATAFLSSLPKDSSTPLFALEQEPNLETAILSVEAKSGYVLSMLGGYSFDRSEFNRSLQACRQPGSSFKPLIYAAALDLLNWTPSTKILDAPITFDDPEAQKRWKPNNFEVKFLGEVTLRTALQNSMNVPSIKVLHAVGLKEAIEYAKKLGIQTQLPPELGLALGQACILMGELVDAYSVFLNQGKRISKKFITHIKDRDGNIIFDEGWSQDPWVGIQQKIERALQAIQTPTEQVIDPETSFLITKLMRNVVMGGTGTPAQALGVPVAGKTGTTNDSFDAWFVGFTTQILTAAWVGYDDYVLPMGRYEQGGRAALPFWLGYMKKAVKGKDTPEFEAPLGIVFTRIDPKTGNRADEGTFGSVLEAYREGTEPTEFTSKQGVAQPDEFFKMDQN